MAQDSESVAARVHPDVKRWLEEQAEEEGTTVGSFVEELLREMYHSEGVVANEDGNLPEAPEPGDGGIRPEQAYEPVYVPNSEKYDYALRIEGGSNRYYKTKQGVISAVERLYSDY